MISMEHSILQIVPELVKNALNCELSDINVEKLCFVNPGLCVILISMSHKKKTKENYITQGVLTREYCLTRSQIRRFLPEPLLRRNPRYSSAAPMKLWRESDVINAINSNKVLKASIEKKQQRKVQREEAAQRRVQQADEFLSSFSPEDLIEQGKNLDRSFVLHVGPTNSGKTYSAIQALERAETGVYLGPLRLLALEMFETLNWDGIPCDLLTGEEYESIPGAYITASTIELCDYTKRYDVAVIDEAQLISNPFRGSSWTSAICLVDAAEVHVCMAPEALPLVEKLLQAMDAPYVIQQHERLVPLEFGGIFESLDDIQPGDALITFSRKSVLAIAAELEKKKMPTSVIYGALPPAARREETRKFAEKETLAVVATDAIGLGISLPIRRVIFVQTEKFDGKGRRPLTASEVKQIAGRAGRFGKYELGLALTMNNSLLIEGSLNEDVPPIEKLQIGFPQEALEYDYPLDKLLARWDSLPENDLFVRSDMSDAEFLLKTLGDQKGRYTREMLYSLITCPVDIKNRQLVDYWLSCCKDIADKRLLSKPDLPEYNLELCETKYQAYDIYHQLSRRIGLEDSCLKEKERLCEKINGFLLTGKVKFVRRCRRCGKPLPFTSSFDLCQRCFEKTRN